MPQLFLRLLVSLVVAAPIVFSHARADGLRAAVRIDTGDFYLWTEGPSAFNLTSYSLTSAAGELVDGNWLSIAGNYDASAGGPVDFDDDWTIISQTSQDLSEGEFLGDGGQLEPFAAVLLGDIWNTTGSRDLELTATEGNTTVVPVTISYIVEGDYDADGDVDVDDYNVWRSGFGITSGASFVVGDGNGDGRVDAADYTVWRDNLGAVTPPAALLVAGVSAIPEPNTLSIVLGIVFMLTTARLRVRSV